MGNDCNIIIVTIIEPYLVSWADHILFPYLNKVDIVFILRDKETEVQWNEFAEGYTLSNKARIQNQICLTLKSDLFLLY